jgi:hypothetical protein
MAENTACDIFCLGNISVAPGRPEVIHRLSIGNRAGREMPPRCTVSSAVWPVPRQGQKQPQRRR